MMGMRLSSKFFIRHNPLWPHCISPKPSLFCICMLEAIKYPRQQSHENNGVKRLLCISLIPRPSHHPLFDCLQCAKMEGEGLVTFITWMTSVSTYRQRGEVVPDWKDAFRARILHCEPRAVCFSLGESSKLQHLEQKAQEKGSSLFFRLETPPPTSSVYLCRHWHHSHGKMDQAPSMFCILQAIKNWMDSAWEGLGMRL